ncbi:MAG: helix-turn-helix domain-containing protein [Alphaproteobacteria bacterium]
MTARARAIRKPRSARERGEMPAPEGLGAAARRQLRRYFAAHGDSLPPPGLYDRILREVERPLLEEALRATDGNQVRAAELLGLNRNTLRKKLLNFGLLNPRITK